MEQPLPDAKQPRRHRLRKWLIGTLLLPVAILLLALCSLYVPGVLDLVASRVLPSVERTTGMEIAVEDIRLRFPLDLKVENALVKQHGDTMVALRNARVDVAFWPLLKGSLKVNDAVVRDAVYKMGGPDSLYIRAAIDSVGASAAMDLNFTHIDVDHAGLDGADVLLVIGPDSTASSKDTTATRPLLITVGPITLANVTYRMAMNGDTIAADMAGAHLSGGRLLVADTIDISAGRVELSVPHALYGKSGAVPLPGLDLDWLEVAGAEAEVDGFTMHGTSLTVPLTSLKLRERCGIGLTASGTFAMDSAQLTASGFRIAANGSTLRLNALLGLDSIAGRAPVHLAASAEVFPEDIAMAMPALTPMLRPLPDGVPLLLEVSLHGTLDSIAVDTLGLSMARVFTLEGTGRADHVNNIDDLQGWIDLNGSLRNPSVAASLLPKGVKLPPLALKATATAAAGTYSAKATATARGGRLALDGTLKATAERYAAKVRLDSFPVGAFMPDMGIGAVTARAEADGRGYNVLRDGASVRAAVRVDAMEFRGNRLGGVELTASLDSSRYTASLQSAIPSADVALNVAGRITPKTIDWRLDGDLRNVDLQRLRLSDSLLTVQTPIVSSGMMATGGDSIAATLSLTGPRVMMPGVVLAPDSLSLTLAAGACSTVAALRGGGMALDFGAACALETLGHRLSATASLLQEVMERRELYADTLSQTLPQFSLRGDITSPNAVNSYLAPQGLSFKNLHLAAANDTSLNLHTLITGFKKGESIALDTITAEIAQRDELLSLDIDLDNRPGTMDEFAHVCLKGAWCGRRGNFFLRQQNISEATGYEIGFTAAASDTTVAIQFKPLNPTIAYKKWTINPGNYLALNTHTKRVHANLRAEGAGSSLQLYSQERAGADSIATNDLLLRVDNIHLQDWLKINPFAPPIAGDASAYVKLRATDRTLEGIGTLTLEDLTYGKQRVGDFDLDINVATTPQGIISGDAQLAVDEREVLTASAVYDTHRQQNDTTGFFVGLNLTDLPLAAANPFLPPQYARLSGGLSGKMKATGSIGSPMLNGHLRFNQARCDVKMIGSGFAFDTIAIPVDSNVVRLNNFMIFGSNDHPLTLNGLVDMRSLSQPQIDLAMRANDMQVVNSKKGKGVELYGRGFVNLDATVRGNMRFMGVNARLTLLPQTSLTYQLGSGGASAIGLQNTQQDMVRFVNFADTSATEQADTVAATSMLMALEAIVDIRQGSTVTVDLSADGQNRAQVKADGVLDFSMNPTQPDGRMTGRLNINSGFFRYSLPIISEKNFSFRQGSYVAFNGPLLNPVLNIHAVDDVKANVTRQGENSRLVVFDVGLGVTGTLEKMDIAFDLSTNDDITVQNELRSMSPGQRANQAMNLLLYGVYTGQNTTGNANLSGNALYGFLTSQLNTWAANTIKGIDLTFGMDQYDRTRDGATSTATQYSYQVSKTLFNDRFKIVVGGNYSTDATSQEDVAQNLISDISLEYLLNDTGSMYLRLFRHTGYESVLEGEITQTGVGFVLRRKVGRLSDIFRISRKRKKQER